MEFSHDNYPAGNDIRGEYSRGNIRFTGIGRAGSHMKTIFDTVCEIEEATKGGYMFKPTIGVSVNASTGKAEVVFTGLDKAICHTQKTLQLLEMLKKMEAALKQESE